MRDDIDFNIEFCEEVGRFPCLYDYNRADYRNRNAKDQAWQKIAQKVDGQAKKIKMSQTGSRAGKSSRQDGSKERAAGRQKTSKTESRMSKTSKSEDKPTLPESKSGSKYAKSESESYRKSDARSLKGQRSEVAGPTESKTGKDVSGKGKTTGQKSGKKVEGSVAEPRKLLATPSAASGAPRNVRDLLKKISEEKDAPSASRSRDKPEQPRSKMPSIAPRASSPDRNEARAKAAEAALSRLEYSKTIGFAKEGSTSSASQLAVQSVLFVCPVVSSEVLPSNQWRPRIITYLAEMSKTEEELSAVLRIHTLNPHKDKVDECVQVLTTYVKNVLADPEEEKYRSIKMSNKAFSEKVLPIKGAVEFLNTAGFRKEKRTEADGAVNDVLHLPGPCDAQKLEMLIDALRTAGPILPQVHRDAMVLKPQEAEERVYLPDDFYDLTEQELAELYKKNLQKLEVDMPLMTKAMRDKEERKHLAKYKYSVLRIRFPDAMYLQGTFGRYDTQRSVKEFVDSCLVKPMAYSLLPPLAKQPLNGANDDKTLLELKLIPAVTLNFIPEDKDKFPKVYLRADMLKKIKKL